jgi:sulfate transport system ATP-binding protein
MEVADRIVVMNEGRIEQVGSPDQVYDHPASPFVLQFLGDVNLFHGRSDHAPGGGARSGDAVYVRPHELEILAEPVPEAWPATLSQALTVGPHTRIEFKRDGDEGYLDVELLRSEYAALRDRLQLQRGSRVYLRPRRTTRFEVPAD